MLNVTTLRVPGFGHVPYLAGSEHAKMAVCVGLRQSGARVEWGVLPAVKEGRSLLGRVLHNAHNLLTLNRSRCRRRPSATAGGCGRPEQHDAAAAGTCYCTVIAQLLHRMLDTVVSFTLSEALAVAAAVGLFLGLFSAAALLVLLRWVEKRLVEARPGGDSRPPRHAEPSVRHVPLEGSLQPARDPAPPTGEQTAEIAVIGLPGLAAEAAAGCLPTHEHACRRLCGWLHAFYSMSVSGVRVQRVWITRNGRMALEASLPAAMAATVLAGSKRLKGTGITLGPVLSPSELREREARRQQQPQPTPVPPQPGRQRRAQRSKGLTRQHGGAASSRRRHRLPAARCSSSSSNHHRRPTAAGGSSSSHRRRLTAAASSHHVRTPPLPWPPTRSSRPPPCHRPHHRRHSGRPWPVPWFL